MTLPSVGRRFPAAALAFLSGVGAPPAARAQDAARDAAPVGTTVVRGQATLVGQSLLPLARSPYAGDASLPARGQSHASFTGTLFLATRVARDLDLYLNPEIAAGDGIAGGGGLAGFSSGELIGQSLYGDRVYFARYLLRWTIRTGPAGPGEVVDDGPNQIGERRPASYVVLHLGKLALVDLLDANAYANDPRTQFLNNAFGNNLAFDFAQEPRGYGVGLVASLVRPGVTVRAATFALPTDPGGGHLSYRATRLRGDQIEVEIRPRDLRRGGRRADDAPAGADALPPTVVRALAFRNLYRGGRYDDALRRAGETGDPPDLAAVRREGAVKYGFGVNVEHPVADGGDTGLFARAGWNDGATESAHFTQSDRFVSVGAQIAGTRWRRPDDRVGVALAQSDIGAAHRDYLAAGGVGLALGDGALRYGPERIAEAYYAWYLGGGTTATADCQFVQNPGYNRDRGPATLVAVRVHTEF